MLDRRQLLQAGLGIVGGLALSSARAESPAPKGLRVAFLTDTHLPGDKPDVVARVAKLVTDIQARPNPPDLFVFGGDNVMAVDGKQSPEQVQNQFDLWTQTFAKQLKTPFLSVIGNHDIWWKTSSTSGTHPEKALAVERYQMPNRYFSKVIGGWRFVLLDCFQAAGCELDEEQWTWLEAELKNTGEPICLVSHAPILSVTHFFEPSTAKGHAYQIPAGWSPKGVVRFRELFRSQPHMKLALSGHMHTIDRVEVDHTAYVCGGAVSGAWWAGDYYGFPPAWVELELQPDGRWTHQIQPWT